MARKKQKVTSGSSNRNFTMISTSHPIDDPTELPPPATGSYPPTPEPHLTTSPYHNSIDQPPKVQRRGLASDLEIQAEEESGRKKSKRRGCCIGFLVFIYVIAMIAMIAAGALFITAATLVKKNPTLAGEPSLPFITTGFMIDGGILVGLGIIGMILVYTKNRGLAIGFILLLLLSLSFHIIFILRTTKIVQTMQAQISDKWDSLSDEVRVLAQQKMNCCGFADTEDRAADPCPDEANKGCGEEINSIFAKLLKGLMIALISVPVGDLIIILLIIILFFWGRNRNDRE